MKTAFIHRISKGSKFNQIYIPKEMDSSFKVGSLVEISLIKRKIYASKNFSLIEFKQTLIDEIFSSLSNFNEIQQIFIVGSFLTKKEDYNDIDILLITKEEISEKVHNFLTNKFNLKFHVICTTKHNLKELTKIDPLIRNMLHEYISTDKIILPKREIDKEHLKFLLMMPEDLLEVNVSGKEYYNSLRRLLAIEKFLENKDENPEKIEIELKAILEDKLLFLLKNNEIIEGNALKKIRETIKNKLDKIKRILNGQK